MIYYDLIEYYKKERNEYNEILLIAKQSNKMRTFRRYIDFLNGRFLWADITEGVSKGISCTTEYLLKYFDLPVTDIHGKYRELKIGSIIQVTNKYGIVEYYKKIDDDVFIECNVNGYVKEPKRHSLDAIFEIYEGIKEFSNV